MLFFSAQHALRLGSFGMLHKILGIPPLEAIQAQAAAQANPTETQS